MHVVTQHQIPQKPKRLKKKELQLFKVTYSMYPSLTSHKEHAGIQYWKVYFTFAYYFLVVPYRFNWDPKARVYVCVTNRFQRMLRSLVFIAFGICYLLRLLVMWNKARVSSAPPPSNSTIPTSQNPTAYFDVAVYFFDSFFMLLLFLHFGRKKDDVFLVFKQLQSSECKRRRKYTKAWAVIILTLCMSTVFVKFVELVQNDGYWDWKCFLSRKTRESSEIFLGLEEAVRKTPFPFIILNVGSTLYEKVLNDFGDILFTMSVLLFQNLVEDFHETLTIETGGDPNWVLERYWWLREVTSQINRAIGTMTFAFIAGNLPFFATTVLDVFGSQSINAYVRFRYMAACSYFFPSICIGARASKKVEDMKEWVCQVRNYEKIPQPKLTVFLHELSFHTVGLSAKGILTINWNSVGSIISIILTYALLKVQFH